MKAIEFLKEYEPYLSLRGIENGLGIPVGTLRRAIIEGRIPHKHEKKIVDRFTFLTREPLSAESAPKNVVASSKEPISVVAKKVEIGDIPDLNKDGSFDMGKWENYVLYVEHTSGRREKYKSNNGKLFPVD